MSRIFSKGKECIRKTKLKSCKQTARTKVAVSSMNLRKPTDILNVHVTVDGHAHLSHLQAGTVTENI
jgi:hypothetical protein